jgi:hypothetical protein
MQKESAAPRKKAADGKGAVQTRPVVTMGGSQKVEKSPIPTVTPP